MIPVTVHYLFWLFVVPFQPCAIFGLVEKEKRKKEQPLVNGSFTVMDLLFWEIVKFCVT